MQVKHLDHVNMTVRDFERTADWYRRLFGFEIVEDEVDENGRWGVLKSGDALLCIYERPDFEHIDRFERSRRKLHGFSHFGLRILDADDWVATAKREKLKINYGGVVEWPHSRSWYVTDPTGYEIEVACWEDDRVRFASPSKTAP